MLYRTLLAAILSAPSGLLFAHGGEDHGAAPALPASTQTVPSGESHSPDFELLAQLHEGTLTVYLDRYADNQPVAAAEIEVQSGAFSASLHEVAPGTYQAQAAPLNTPGAHELVFTILAGEQSDLLDTVLTVGAASDAGPAASARPAGIWLAAGALLALLAGAALLWRRRRNPSQSGTPS